MAFYARAATRTTVYTDFLGRLHTAEEPAIPAGVEFVALRAPSGGGSQPWGVKTTSPLPTTAPLGSAYTVYPYATVVQFAAGYGFRQADVDGWGGWGA